MDKKDRIALRILTVAFILLVIGLAYFGWALGQSFQESSRGAKSVIATEQEKNDLQEQKIALLEKRIEQVSSQVPAQGPEGPGGTNGRDGKDGKTTVENHDTQTVIEKQIPATPIDPIPGLNGKTPEFAIDGETNKLFMRYQGDDDWRPVPVLCKTLTVLCQLGN